MQTKILQAAKMLFLERGVKRVSVDDICQQLHISKKTFYVYYASKEELLDDALNHLSEEIQQKRCECFRGMTPIEIFTEIANHIDEYLPDHKGTAIWYDLHKYYPQIAEKHERIQAEQMRKSLGNYLRQGQRDGYFRSDLNVDLFMYFFESMHVRMKELAAKNGVTVEDRHYDLRDIVTSFMDIFTHSVLKVKS